MLKRIWSAVLALMVFLSLVPCAAADASVNTVRVAVLDYPRYSALDENGDPTGLAMDYLSALARYTDWTYEYVPLTLGEARQQLADGRIDIIPGRSLSFSDEALYADKSMGVTTTVLVSRSDDERYAFQDYDAFKGMRVGMLAGTDYHFELEQMQQTMGFQVDTVVYDTHPQCMAALASGEVDALLMLSIRRDETTKDIARFGSTDLFMAVTPTRPELLNQLNYAQEQLYANDPYCLLTWWEKYYSDSMVSLNLTRAELDYLSKLDVLRVGVLNTVPVYSYLDKNGKITGILPDTLHDIAEKIGVPIEITAVGSAQGLAEGLFAGEFDMILPLHVTEDTPVPDTVKVLPLQTETLSMVGLDPVELSSTSSMSIALGFDAPLLIQAVTNSLPESFSLVASATPEDSLKAVLDGKVDAAIAPTYSLQKLLERPAYSSLFLYPVYSAEVSLCFGLNADANELLMSALTKTIGTLSSEEQQASILRHTVGTPYQLTLQDIMREFRQPLTIVVISVIVLAAVIISVGSTATVHKRRIAASRAALDRETQQRQALEQQREADNRHREELRFMATHDTLTGLYNMNGFALAVKRLLDAHPDEEFKIVYMDINGFKVYCDLFGAKAGEELILTIANRFEELATPEMAYAQVYKDHFVVCVRASVDTDALNDREYRWLQELIPGYELTPCFGEYIIHDRSMAVSTMCDRAIAAMNTVKGLYPPQVGRYSQELRQRLVEEQWITANMRHALQNGEFIPYFQPQYHLYTGQITGAEVLVRWDSPERGRINPDQFIHIFEKNGFITELDQYIWEVACRWLSEWLDAGNPPIALSINASRLDVRNLDLPTLLPDLVARYNLPPALVRLEITESAYMQDPEQLIRTMRALQQLGFTIEMDDFGSGYSSLNLLKDVPVDVLKLDMRFLSSGDEFGRSSSIIRSVVNMSKWLNLSVIAEGVETVQQSDFLKSVGCTYAQGYRYSKPLDQQHFEELLRTSSITFTNERLHSPIQAVQDRSIDISARSLILLVDNQEIRRSRLREILGSQYDYFEADSGQKALHLLQGGLSPDCVILDADMPGMSGCEVLASLRERPETSELPVLMLIPFSGESPLIAQALEAGVNDFIHTPFNPEMIRHRVQTQLLLKTAIRQAHTDGLTGLLNRTAFRHYAEQALQSSEGSPAQGMMMVLDLDSFKTLNDLYGHPFGDRVLTSFADMLTELCGEHALIGRLGGDEFGILVPNLPSREEMQHLADRILRRASQIVIGGVSELVSCSLGASIYPADFVRRADLYAAADKALYAAKQKGDGKVMFYDQVPRKKTK